MSPTTRSPSTATAVMYPDHPQGRRITRRRFKPGRRHNRGGRSWVTTQHDPRQRSSQRAPIAHNGSRPAGGAAQVQREPVHLPAKQIAPAAGRLRHGFRAAYHHKNRPRKRSPRQWIKPQHNAAGHKTNGSPHNGNSAQRVQLHNGPPPHQKAGGINHDPKRQ